MGNYKINRKLLPMKLHFFLYNAAIAPVVPFMSTYAKQLGFSPVVVGTLYTILPVAGMVAKPLFGGIADKFKNHKFLFLLFIALTGILFFCMNFIPDATTTNRLAQLDCGSQTEIRSCNHTNDPCAVDRILDQTAENTTKCDVFCPAVSSSEWDKYLCENWKLNEYCNSSYTGEHSLEFIANVPINHTVMVADCLYFRVQSAYFGEENTTVIPYCDSKVSTYGCTVTCTDPYINEIVTQQLVENKEDIFKYPTFWTFSFFMLTSWIAMAVVVSIGDAICFDLLGDKPNNYGLQRVWGSVGWGLLSVLSGYLVDVFSRGKSYKVYDVVFYITLIIASIDLFAAFKIKVKIGKISENIFQDVGKLLSYFRINIFLIWCVAVGMCTGLLWNFLFWHLEDLAMEQGCESVTWMKTLQGLVLGVQCFLGEVPFFFLSGWILKKIGHINTMSLVLLGYSVRFFAYYLLVNPWWVLPIELLNGVTFGLFYATMASYASMTAPPGTEATVQGFVGAIFEGIGVSLGSFLGGILYSEFGGSITFAIYSLGAFILFALHVTIKCVLKHKFNEETKSTVEMDNNREMQMTTRYSSPVDAIDKLDGPFESDTTDLWPKY